MRRLFMFGSCLLALWLGMMACPAPEGPKSCNTISDCPTGQRCIAKKCKEVVDAGQPDKAKPDTAKADTAEAAPESQPEPQPEPTPEPQKEESAPEFDPNAPCKPGAARLCYDGPKGTRGVGSCIQGRSSCLQSRKWDTCLGQTLPKEEVCNGKDDDCDGTADEDAKCDACSECVKGKCVVGADVAPKLKKLSPNPIVYISTVTIVAEGECFAEKAEIVFDGKPVMTTFVSRTKLEAVLDLTNVIPGKYPVTIKNPNGKTSTTIEFEITRPMCSGPRPSIRQLQPNNAEAGKKIAFTVEGFSFVSGSQIIFDGKPIPTKFANASQLTADPTLDLTNVAAGDYKVHVASPNGCDSTMVNFFVVDAGAKPQITSITPSTIKIGQSNRLTIKGKNFLPGVAMYISLNAIAGIRFIGSTQLEVTFTPKAADGWTAGTKQAYVINTNQAQSNFVQLTFQ